MLHYETTLVIRNKAGKKKDICISVDLYNTINTIYALRKIMAAAAAGRRVNYFGYASCHGVDLKLSVNELLKKGMKFLFISEAQFKKKSSKIYLKLQSNAYF